MKAVYDCKRSIRVAALVVVTTGGGLTGLPSMAQNTVVGLEEVVVTARKREENLQDVSMSITAISSQEIEKLGLSNIADVSRLDASLIYDNGYSATDNRISIRGLSPTRGRVTVAVLVDGIDVSSESIQFGGGSLDWGPRQRLPVIGRFTQFVEPPALRPMSGHGSHDVPPVECGRNGSSPKS